MTVINEQPVVEIEQKKKKGLTRAIKGAIIGFSKNWESSSNSNLNQSMISNVSSKPVASTSADENQLL